MIEPDSQKGLRPRTFKLWLFGILAVLFLLFVGGVLAWTMDLQSWADAHMSGLQTLDA